MGKWQCKNCDTINDEKLLTCEVCDSISPHICNFACDCSDISNLSPCKWSTNAIDTLLMQVGDGEKFEVLKNEIELDIKKNTIVRFYASNKIADRIFEFPIIIKKPTIDDFEILNAPLYSDQKVELSWSVKNAEKCTINGDIVPSKGKGKYACSLKLQLVAHNSTGSVKKILPVKVIPFPTVTYKCSKTKLKASDSKGTTLKWGITNALSAKLKTGEKDLDVKLSDSITVHPKETTSYILEIIGLDGKRIFEECVTIEVYPEASFTFNVDNNKVLANTPFSLRWNTQNAKSVCLDGKNVEAKGNKIIADGIQTDTSYTLSITDEFETRTKSVRVKIVPPPTINLSTSKTKLHKGRNESVTINWGVQNAEKITLLQDGVPIDKKCGHDDSYKCSIKDTTTFTVQALALDGKTTFSDSVIVEVHPDAKFKFESDKEYAFPTIPFTLSWTTKHAKRVELNGKKVADNGTEIIKKGVDKDTTYTLAVTDEFGIKESSITVKMLPVPRINALLVPTPDIQQTITMNVDLKLPNITVSSLDTQLQEVELIGASLYNTELEAIETPQFIDLQYKLKTPTLWQKLEKSIAKLLHRNENR